MDENTLLAISLSETKGIGPIYFHKLLKRFESFKNIYFNASIDELSEIVPEHTARRILERDFTKAEKNIKICERHNIKIIAPAERGFPVAVPYDFDHAGMIYTSYANPPEFSGITSVRSRVFRGLCRFNNGYNKTIDLYQKLKPDLFSLVQNDPYLSDRSKKSLEKYLESFYEILDNLKKVSQKIRTVCRAKHKHLYETQ